MEEDELEKVSNELGIEMTTGPNVYIEGSSDERLSNILADKNVNVDELINLSFNLHSYSLINNFSGHT